SELYSPPKIPPNWKSSKSSSTLTTLPYISTAEAAKASTLVPSARASILGETPLPSKSVFDYMTPAARARIASASGKANLPVALSEAAPKGYSLSASEKEKELWNLVPKLDKDAAVQALNRSAGGWMPYAEDEA